MQKQSQLGIGTISSTNNRNNLNSATKSNQHNLTGQSAILDQPETQGGKEDEAGDKEHGEDVEANKAKKHYHMSTG